MPVRVGCANGARKKGLIMWEHKCMAERKRGGQCTRKSTTAVWCFQFQTERYRNPTWVETCGYHWTEAQSIVSTLAIHS